MHNDNHICVPSTPHKGGALRIVFVAAFLAVLIIPALAVSNWSALKLLPHRESESQVDQWIWPAINDFFNNILNAGDFSSLWNSGKWSVAHGWLHIASDYGIWLSCMVLAIVAICSLRKDPGIPYSKVLWLISAAVLVCGSTHLMEALAFWWPAYRLLGVLKAGGALLLLLATIVLVPCIPRAMTLRSPTELQREIVQRRRTEFELRQVHDQLEGVIEQRTAELASKKEEMEQFLNTVSHDLKSPIVTCLGLTGMIRDDINAGRIEETSDTIDRVDRAMNRMRHLIDDLLGLSRIGKIRFDIVDVDTSALLRSIVEELQPRAKQVRAALQIKNSLPRVRGDVHWLTEVFENLITNALKYGCDNPNPRITIGSVTREEEVLIYVRDNGHGIEPGQHARVFEPFRRLHSEKEGSGMGLAIVARIIKMHGGRVWIQSELGRGATFWVALPANAVPDDVRSPSSENVLISGECT